MFNDIKLVKKDYFYFTAETSKRLVDDKTTLAKNLKNLAENIKRLYPITNFVVVKWVDMNWEDMAHNKKISATISGTLGYSNGVEDYFEVVVPIDYSLHTKEINEILGTKVFSDNGEESYDVMEYIHSCWDEYLDYNFRSHSSIHDTVNVFDNSWGTYSFNYFDSINQEIFKNTLHSVILSREYSKNGLDNLVKYALNRIEKAERELNLDPKRKFEKELQIELSKKLKGQLHKLNTSLDYNKTIRKILARLVDSPASATLNRLFTTTRDMQTDIQYKMLGYERLSNKFEVYFFVDEYFIVNRTTQHMFKCSIEDGKEKFVVSFVKYLPLDNKSAKELAEQLSVVYLFNKK